MKYEKHSLSEINGILSDMVAEEGGWGKRISKDQEFEADWETWQNTVSKISFKKQINGCDHKTTLLTL